MDAVGTRLGIRPHESYDPLVRVIEVGDGSARDLWKVPYRNCNYLAPSPDGRLVAAGSLDGGDGVMIWELATGRPVLTLAIADDAQPGVQCRRGMAVDDYGPPEPARVGMPQLAGRLLRAGGRVGAQPKYVVAGPDDRGRVRTGSWRSASRSTTPD